MLVIVKSAPDTSEGKRGIKLARDMAADLLLLQSGVYFAQKEWFESFCGMVYVLDEDIRLRGLKDNELINDIKKLNYNEIIDLMAKEDKVVGMF